MTILRITGRSGCACQVEVAKAHSAPSFLKSNFWSRVWLALTKTPSSLRRREEVMRLVWCVRRGCYDRGDDSSSEEGENLRVDTDAVGAMIEHTKSYRRGSMRSTRWLAAAHLPLWSSCYISHIHENQYGYCISQLFGHYVISELFQDLGIFIAYDFMEGNKYLPEV